MFPNGGLKPHPMTRIRKFLNSELFLSGLKTSPSTSLFQALCQWRIKKAGGRRVGSDREKLSRDPALSFSLPDPARR